MDRPRKTPAFAPVLRVASALLAAAWFAAGLPGAAAAATVDANTATQAQLESVAGIGPVMARRILDERAKGPFKDLADFRARVRGVGDARARRLAQAGLRFGGAERTAAARGAGAVVSPAAAGKSDGPRR